mgnify:CR=1 FL=1|jgi:hypothetical protein
METSSSTSLAIIETQDEEIPESILVAVRTLVPAQVLSNEAEVRKELPQVIGKLLALCWINNELASYFLSNTKNFLDKIKIELPDSIIIEVKKETKAKPSITVFQIAEGSKYKQRLFKLSLKLIANR